MSDTMFDAMFGAAIAGGGSGGGFTPTETQLAAINSGITATDVEQINTNKTNISSVQQTISNISPRTISYTYRSTAADTYELIPQLTVTLPHDKTICISAAASRNGANAITGIQIQHSDTQSDENIIGIAEATATYRCLTATGMYKNTSNADTTINIYVKCDGGNILHNCYVFYWYI